MSFRGFCLIYAGLCLMFGADLHTDTDLMILQAMSGFAIILAGLPLGGKV